MLSFASGWIAASSVVEDYILIFMLQGRTITHHAGVVDTGIYERIQAASRTLSNHRIACSCATVRCERSRMVWMWRDASTVTRVVT